MAVKSVISKGLRFLVTAAALGAAACDYVRPDELFVPEADAIVVGAVLNEGWAHVYLIASHPHRHPSEPAPEVRAILTGPGGDVAFDKEVDLSRCGVLVEGLWHGPAICLQATLAHPVRTASPAPHSPFGPMIGDTPGCRPKCASTHTWPAWTSP